MVVYIQISELRCSHFFVLSYRYLKGVTVVSAYFLYICNILLSRMTGVTMILSESGKRDSMFLGVTEKHICLFYYVI